MQVREEVTLTVFDEVIEDDAHRGGFLEGEITSRVEKRYLGMISIPISTLVNEGRIEGTLRLHSPLYNFGYSLRSQINRRIQRNIVSNMFITQGEQQDENAENLIAIGQGPSWFSYMPEFLKEAFTNNTPIAANPQYDSHDYLTEECMKEFGYFASGNSASFLSVMLTIEPLIIPISSNIRAIDRLPSPSTLLKSIQGGEVSHLSHARQWLTELMNLTPYTKYRPYTVFATDNTGYNVFLPRFLTTGMQIPTGFHTRRSILHLVSLIPFIPDSQSFIGENDLWCTMAQTFEIGAGDEEEHAVMTYNFLLAIRNPEIIQIGILEYPSHNIICKEDLFLALGTALPEGNTVYVIMKDMSKKIQGTIACNYLIVNTCTGYVYNAADIHCPLRTIHTLITPYNIFANIQISDEPSKIDYDVSNTSNWKPFYCTRFPFPSTGLTTVQNQITFVPTSSAYCLEIENTLKTSLKSHIRKWRSKRKRYSTLLHFTFLLFTSRYFT